jgi:hypothetical protein
VTAPTKAPARRYPSEVTVRDVQAFDDTTHCLICNQRWQDATKVVTVLVGGHKVQEIGACSDCAQRIDEAYRR